ncbi:MAG: hypothetical protein ACK5N9_11030, partial [Pirellula sp.]
MAKLTPSRTQELTNVIEQQTQKNPNWLGGQAMMALIELSGKSKEAGQKRMEAILAKEETIKNMPYEACWFIGQELANNKAMESLAIRLLKEADARQDNNGMNDLNYTPIGTLVRVLGNRPEERSFLKKRIEEREKSAASQLVTYGDPGYDNYQKVQQALSLSRAYLSIGCPVDAFLAVKSIEGTYDPAAVNRYMGGANEVQSQIQTAMDSATSAINDQNLTESLDRLLPLDRPIDLMVKTPKNSGTDKSTITAMRSELLELLRAAAKETDTKQSISNRLNELVKSRPTELPIRIMHALWLMDQDCDGNTLLHELKQLIELTKLEPIAEGRRPNSRQRQEAKLIMHQWLVAREILTDNASTVAQKPDESSSEDKPASTKQPRMRSFASNEECRQIATQIAEQAIEAGMRQLTRAEQCVVLLELANLQSTQKDLERAEKNWQRLLSLATTTIGQPSTLSKAEEKARTDESNTSAKPARQPPLTISQFRIVLAVHNMAAENGRMDIAASALGASLRGGLPVADPDTSAPDPRRNLVAANSGTARPAVDPIEQEVQATIRKSLNYWNTSGEAPPEILNALRLVILPPSRVEEIRPYVNGAAVETGREESLASLMVKIAAKTNQLDSLKKEIESRNAKATSLLAKKVILSLIAIEKNDFDTAKAFIEELNLEAEKLSAQSSVQILGIAALRAFSIPELKDTAIPVLKKLSVAQLAKMEKTEDSDDDNTDSSVDVFSKDLPRKLNRYLVAKGDARSVRETLESFLEQRSATYERYSDSSYLQYLQGNDLQQLAHYAANLGMLDYAAELVGRYADIAKDERYGGATFHISMALEYLVTGNRALAPEARFKFWYDWTIPKENPSNIRFIVSWPNLEIITNGIESLLEITSTVRCY